ncbi:tubulin epsilon and delta complex protein 1-like, partial [Dysidea avara]|uniref:tubulin epsilon and delta complex protein 1-like n=1 Tax=Dysidea avara TaxID=196820 RepID=UPI00333175DA
SEEHTDDVWRKLHGFKIRYSCYVKYVSIVEYRRYHQKYSVWLNSTSWKQTPSEQFQQHTGVINPAFCVAKVKTFFYDLGYVRSEFYAASYAAHSRELLLAFGWLLNEVQLLTMMRRYHLTQAHVEQVQPTSGYHVMVTMLLDEVSHLEMECSEISGALKSERRQNGSICEGVKRLAWLNGRIMLSYKQLSEAYNSLAQLIHRLDRFSYNETRQNQVSFYGWYLLLHPQELSRQVKKLEHHITALQSIAEWHNHDALFWKWMESVIDSCKKDIDTEANTMPTKDSLFANTDTLYKKITLLLHEKEAQISVINQMWEARSLQVNKQDLKKELCSIDNEFKSSVIYFEVLKSSYRSPQAPELNRHHSLIINRILPDFIFTPIVAANPVHRSLHNLEQISCSQLSVTNEVDRLRQCVSEVDDKLALLRTEVKAKCDSLISAINPPVFVCNK